MPKRLSKKSSKHVLVLDVGTTGVKAIVFDSQNKIVSRIYRPLNKFVGRKGRVEQNPTEILTVSRDVLARAVKESGLEKKDFLGLSLTNQRETTILWNKFTGRPIYPAIVWEDERTKKFCGEKKEFAGLIRNKTGLKILPYFSASKINWIFNSVKSARDLLKKNQILFGTVDSWIIWNFLNGKPHLTDQTNASRTLLWNIKKNEWDKELLKIFGVPKKILPKVKSSRANFGKLKKDILGFEIPLLAVAGDQEASLFAAGSKKGITKVTFGTGIFISQIIGSKFQIVEPFFVTPVAGENLFSLEAKIGNCGKRVARVLGKPTQMRKLISGFSKQVNEYIKKLPLKPKEIIVDGGVTQYKDLVKILNKVTGIKIKKQKIYDGTALGAAMLGKK